MCATVFTPNNLKSKIQVVLSLSFNSYIYYIYRSNKRFDINN